MGAGHVVPVGVANPSLLVLSCLLSLRILSRAVRPRLPHQHSNQASTQKKAPPGEGGVLLMLTLSDWVFVSPVLFVVIPSLFPALGQ